jgi:beta-galactosidase GanA
MAKQYCIGILFAFVLTPSLFGQSRPDIPHLLKHGSTKQLIVDGKPFLILGGELYNSSSSSLSYMEPIWPRLKSLNLNSVLVPVSWELIEPQEGKFDFTIVDGLIAAAHEHDLRLVFLWFGSWKNTYSSYVPEWVKRDTKRFPRVLLLDGRPTERLTPLSETNRKADTTAFAALMKHVAQVDSGHTVIMVQVENEVGVIPESRDFSEMANTAFADAVPKTLMEFIRKHEDELSAELRGAWVAGGKKTSGNWQQVFGDKPITDDFFMAWAYATYIDGVTAAGKAEYPLPMYVNAALVRPNYQPGQYNSGGPLPHSMDIYRAGAPHVDFLSPDIYFDNFAEWAGKYKREGNTLFVPEAKGGSTGSASAFYSLGQLDAIGFSPFAIDGRMEAAEAETTESAQQAITTTYFTLAHLAPMILEKQGTGEMAAVVLEGEAQRAGRIFLGGYMMEVRRAGPPNDSRISVLVIQERPDQFLVAGSGAAQVSFLPNAQGAPIAGIASIDQEELVDGKWIWQRRLNGDEDAQGQLLKLNSDGIGKPSVYRLRLYRY